MSSRNSDATPRSQPTRRLARDRPPPLGAILRVSGAKATPSELRLVDGGCVIGAGAEADIIVDDRAVSRRHAELELCADGVGGTRSGEPHSSNLTEAARRCGLERSYLGKLARKHGLRT